MDINMAEIILNVKQVSKIYKDRNVLVHALDNVSLTIYKGEVLALLGINGAGKTTLSSILATLHPPTSGEILFKGISIYKNLSRYRQSLGYCPQKPNLDQYLTVQENLIFAGRYFLMDEKEIIARALELMESFELIRYANFNVNSLSGGYQQRLSIARALMHKPEIVILDEPTVGLDPGIRRQLWEIILQLKQQQITVILTTHYLDEAEALSDRACILHRGKIMLTERISELKARHKKATFEEVFLELTRTEDAGINVNE